MGEKRIIEYTEQSSVDNTDYMLTDSGTKGSKKYQVSRILSEAAADAQTKVDAEAAAREAADNELKADYLKALIYEQTDPAEIASFTDGADDFPIKSLKLNIDPHQAGSGDPSPTNVRAISGYTSVNVARAGKNLAKLRLSGEYTENGITWTVLPSGKVHVKGTASNGSSYLSGDGIGWTFVFEVPIIHSGTYFATTGRSDVYFRLGKGSSASFVASGFSAHRFDDLEADKYYIGVYVTNGTTIDADVAVQFVAGTEAGDFEPYMGADVYPITIPTSAGTVYGGELDVMRGVLKITHKSINLGSLSWTEWPNLSNIFRLNLPVDIKRVDNSVVPDWFCSTYMVREGTAISSTDFTIGQINQAYLLCHDSRYTTASDLKTALNGQLLVYELATVAEYTLTQPEINTLLGANNIWMDADGTVEVEYPADLKMYIDSKLS